MTISIDPANLLGWYQSFYGGTGTGSTSPAAGGAGAASAKYAPTPPWDPSLAHPSETQRATAALNGAPFVDPNAAKLDLPGASADYKNLFALYQGLSTLYSLADQASGTNVSSFRLSQLASAFTSGLAQVSQFVSQTSYGKLRLTTGTTAASETTTGSTPAQPTVYQTPALNTTGDSSAVVPAFQGTVRFDVNVKGGSADTTVHMDLADMGSTPRTMGNVVAYLNAQMKAAGAVATFSSNPMPAQPEVIQVAGKSVTLSSGQAQWGLRINTDPFETVTFSAPQTAPAVYVGQVVGNQSSSVGAGGVTTPPDAQSQLLKFQVGGAAITPPAPGAHAVPGQLFADSLGAAVKSVQATTVAPDGSVYVLADVNGAAAGGQDAALLKYDSAGKLLFQTDLGSASSATGLSLAVSGDGARVAVAGSVTGPLTPGQALANPSGANSFTTVFDSQGDQVWSQEHNGIAGNQASGVAFGADGSVYVTGQTATAVGGSLGPTTASNGFLQVFSPAGNQLSNIQFGAGGEGQGSGVAVDGSNVYVAGVENGHAVVNQYDVSNPAAPSLVASRDLGDLQGGDMVGVSVQNGTVYVAGNTRNGALTAGAVTSAYSGGVDAFAVTLSTGLAPAASDAIAYYGGAGDDRATAMAVSGGEVWLTGSSAGPLPGRPALGALDGFVAQLNVAAGSVDWSQRFTGLDGQVAPTSIAVAPTGASILDQLGLPQGVVDGPVSNLLTSGAGVKVGDSFSIATSSHSATKITISATDTVASLAAKITHATGGTVNVSVHQLANSTKLEIQPLDPFSTVTLTGGPAGSDALGELGLKAGVIFQTTKHNGVVVPADGKAQVYGLGLDASLSLGSASAITHAKAQLTAAMSVIKGAYQGLKTAATPANVLALQKAQASGKVPAYLNAQIASYRSALARLTAGQTSTTTTGA